MFLLIRTRCFQCLRIGWITQLSHHRRRYQEKEEGSWRKGEAPGHTMHLWYILQGQTIMFPGMLEPRERGNRTWQPSEMLVVVRPRVMRINEILNTKSLTQNKLSISVSACSLAWPFVLGHAEVRRHSKPLCSQLQWVPRVSTKGEILILKEEILILCWRDPRLCSHFPFLQPHGDSDWNRWPPSNKDHTEFPTHSSHHDCLWLRDSISHSVSHGEGHRVISLNAHSQARLTLHTKNLWRLWKGSFPL